jgi:HNH endonuclease
MIDLDECWAPIYGFPNYEVSTNGRIYGHYRDVFLIPWVSEWGYYQVGLSNRGEKTNATVHRLVAEAFLPGSNYLFEVNHIDGDKLNNHVSNLEWLTREENMQHAHDTGLITPKRRQVENLDTGEIYSSISEAAQKLGCGRGALATTIKLRGSYKGINLRYKD